jgi:hypothetical protein
VYRALSLSLSLDKVVRKNMGFVGAFNMCPCPPSPHGKKKKKKIY